MSPHFQRATFLFDQGRFIEAEADLRAALSHGDDFSHVHALLGLCLARAGLVREGRREVEAALARSPGDPYNHYAMSFIELPAITHRDIFGQRRRTMISSKTARGCLQCVLRAVELAPFDTRFLIRLTEVFQMLGKWKESIEPARIALSLSPGSCPAAVKLAEAFVQLRRPAEAREVVYRALEMNPAAALAHAGMGWALLRAGDHERAEQFFNEALRVNAGLEWAQEGALECAKQHYHLYRWLVRSKSWIEGQHWFWGIIVGLLLAGALLGFLAGYFIWVDPVLRKLLGNGGFAALTLAWVVGGCVLLFFHNEIFLGFVRRKAAANTSVGMRHRRVTGRMLLCMAIGGAFVPVDLFLERFSKMGPLILAALVPGIFGIVVVIKTFPAGKRRWFWVAYVSLALSASLAAIVGLFKYVEESPQPKHVMLVMFLPLIPLLMACDAENKRRQKQEHIQAVDAAAREQNLQRRD